MYVIISNILPIFFVIAMGFAANLPGLSIGCNHFQYGRKKFRTGSGRGGTDYADGYDYAAGDGAAAEYVLLLAT